MGSSLGLLPDWRSPSYPDVPLLIKQGNTMSKNFFNPGHFWGMDCLVSL